MGCDIHLHFERKEKDGWKEIPIEDYLIPNDRNYVLFGFLASVRGSHDGLFDDRGIPDDCSDTFLRDNPDMFSHTYAYLDEILNAPWRRHNLQDTYFHIFCRDVLPRICTQDPSGLTGLEYRDVRVIMAFSN
jgi:hypothetical protein